MKNNYLKLTALWMVVACFAACQHDVDVIGVSEGLAKKNMLGAYTHTAVDSALMQVTKIEYKLTKDASDATKNYCRKSVAGDKCTLSDEIIPMTWETAIAANKISMIVTVTLENGETKQLSWWDGQLHEGEDTFVKSGSSEIDAQKAVYDDLFNTEFVANETDYYEHEDTVKFLAWTTDVDYFAPEDTTQAKEDYLTGLEKMLAGMDANMDTIKWYIQNVHSVGKAYVDAEGNLQGVIWVDPEPAKRGKNAGKHGITHLILLDTLQWRIEQINDRPMKHVESNMSFLRTGEDNTGEYYYHIETWTEEYYTEPGSAKAIATDSVYSMKASAWALTSIASSKKFDVLMKGKETVNGVEKEEAFTTIKISGFDKAKGEATVGETSYKLKQ